MQIMRVLFGSHLYGTNTEASDTDYKAIHLPTPKEILLQSVRDTIVFGRYKQDGERNTSSDVDVESYSLQYYLKLLAEGQTIAIDMLFAPSSYLQQTSDLWEHIKENRGRLLSTKSTAFVGYCRTQASKYGIKSSRVDAAKKASEFFNEAVANHGTTAKVGELAHCFEDLLDDHTNIVTKETTQGREETYFECCNRMVNFKNTLKEAAKIFTRIYEEYGQRARQAQANDGIDWKALSHAVRVGEEALELLVDHRITFPRPNAHILLKIKQGKLTYNAVAETIENLLSAVEEASKVSTLPSVPDLAWVDSTVEKAYAGIVLSEYS